MAQSIHLQLKSTCFKWTQALQTFGSEELIAMDVELLTIQLLDSIAQRCRIARTQAIIIKFKKTMDLETSVDN